MGRIFWRRCVKVAVNRLTSANVIVTFHTGESVWRFRYYPHCNSLWMDISPWENGHDFLQARWDWSWHGHTIVTLQMTAQDLHFGRDRNFPDSTVLIKKIPDMFVESDFLDPDRVRLAQTMYIAMKAGNSKIRLYSSARAFCDYLYVAITNGLRQLIGGKSVAGFLKHQTVTVRIFGHNVLNLSC